MIPRLGSLVVLLLLLSGCSKPDVESVDRDPVEPVPLPEPTLVEVTKEVTVAMVGVGTPVTGGLARPVGYLNNNCIDVVGFHDSNVTAFVATFEAGPSVTTQDWVLGLYDFGSEWFIEARGPSPVRLGIDPKEVPEHRDARIILIVTTTRELVDPKVGIEGTLHAEAWAHNATTLQFSDPEQHISCT